MMLLHVHQGDKPAVASFPDEVSAKLGELKLSAGCARGFRSGFAQD